jgi:hypothetical protein
MADVILTTAGQVIGGAIGGPIGAAIGGAIGGAIGQTFTPTQKFQGPRLGDLRVTGTEYGQTIPFLQGYPRIAGQIIWASRKREIANTQKQGKGGGGGAETTTYTYEVDVAYLLSENPIKGVSRVWVNGELAAADSGTPTNNFFIDSVLVALGQIKKGQFKEMRVYTGSDTQMPDSLIEANKGVGNTPAYRGRGYVVLRSLQLGTSGQLPNITFEVPVEPIGIEDFCITPSVTNNISILGEPVGPYYLPGETVSTSFVTAEVLGTNPTLNTLTGRWEQTIRFRMYDIVTDALLSTSDRTVTMIDRGLGASAYKATYFRNFPYACAMIGGPANSTIRFFESLFETSMPGFSTGGLNPVSDISCAFGGNRFWWTINQDYIGSVNQDLLNDFIAYRLDDLSPPHQGQTLQIVTDPVTGRTFKRFNNKNDLTEVYFAELATNNPRVELWRAALPNAGNVAVYGNRLYVSGYTPPDTPNSALEHVTVFRIGEDSLIQECGFLVLSPDFRTLRNPAYLVGDERAYVSGRVVAGGGLTVNIGLQPSQLPDTLSRLMLRAGYTTGQYDVSLTAGDVHGLALSQVSGTRSAMELLQAAYFFEAAKDDKVRMFLRKTDAVVTIPYADLGFSFDGGDQEQLVLTNSNDLELPAQIAVQYANILGDYQAATEFSDRLLTEQESTNVVQLALGFFPEEAKVIADKMIADLIAGQWRFTIKLPLKYAYMMPGDIFNVVARDGRSFRGRVQSKKDSQVLIELECVLDSVGTLDVDAATDASYVSQTTIIDPSVTEWEAMDIPLLRDADNNVSWYGAITPILVDETQWPGGVLVQSFSPPAYTQLYTTGDLSAIGECDTTLGNWPHGAMFDETNTLTVTLYAGELESVARADMLLDQELNAAAVGVDGRWELIRFRDAELTGQTSDGLNIYKISGLLRGQRGTEWAIGLHNSGERFVLLDATIRNIPSQLNELNLERFIKGATANSVLDDITERSFTHTGVSLKPFSVAQLRGLADGSDVEVTWNRRTRLSYRYAGVNPVVPLGEASELYRVWIYDGSTLVRTEDVTTDSYTYAAADIASDGFVTSDTIRIEVAQVSAIVGAGYIEEIEVIAP